MFLHGADATGRQEILPLSRNRIGEAPLPIADGNLDADVVALNV